MSGTDGDPVCGSRDTSSGEPCQNPVEDPDSTCHLHPESEHDGGGSGSERDPDPTDGEERTSGSGDEPTEEDLPEPPEECPDCGEPADDFEPVRPSIDGEPRGWKCGHCSWKRKFCMKSLEDGHCSRKVSGWGRCYMHGDDGDVPDEHGAPEDNDNAVGNSGGKPGRSGPPGNFNAMQSGVWMSLERRLEAMSEEQREAFKGYFQTYVGDCQNPTRAARIATAEVLADEIEVDLFGGQNDLTRLVHTENGSFQQFKKDEIQSLKALMTEVRMSLKEETEDSGGSSGHDNLEILVTGDSG